MNRSHSSLTQLAPRGGTEHPLRLLFSKQLWRSIGFMLLSFPIGLFWFVALLTLFSLGFGMAVAWVGLPLLAGTVMFWIHGAKAERKRVGALFGTPIPNPYRPLPEGSILRRGRTLITDPAIWRDLLYLVLLFPLGLAEFIAVTVFLSGVVSLIGQPIVLILGLPSIQVITHDAPWTVATVVASGLLSLLVVMVGPSLLLRLARGHEAIARKLLGPDRNAELAARVATLTDSRSRIIDAALTERRRIERDLHDGAQQRLVALAMTLGMAREKLATDPAGAQALVDEAHQEAKETLAEIRDLVRGIHPAVLTDRGLDAAISALAGRSPVPVNVDVILDGRLPEAVESTAYFIVAEALSNIAKHSQATAAWVSVREQRGRLIIDVMDNGEGGVDPSRGTGLMGLADRVAALDGVLNIESPRGGPTQLHAELPCGS